MEHRPACATNCQGPAPCTLVGQLLRRSRATFGFAIDKFGIFAGRMSPARLLNSLPCGGRMSLEGSWLMMITDLRSFTRVKAFVSRTIMSSSFVAGFQAMEHSLAQVPLATSISFF